MTARKLVAVQQSASALTNAGAVVWWRLSGTAEVACLTDALSTVPFTAPSAPTPEAALKRGMAAAGATSGSRRMARRMDERGRRLAVVRERTTEGQDDLDYEVEQRGVLESRPDGAGGVVTVLVTTPHVPAIHAAYDAALGVLTSDDVGLWLARSVVPACDGVSLRDTGGVYFIPATKLAQFRAITRAVSACSSHRFNELPCYLDSDQAVEDLLDSLATSITSDLAKIQAKAESGLGEKAAKTQHAAILALHERVARYETLLGVKAAHLHAACDTLAAHSAFSTLADLGSVFAGLDFGGGGAS